MVGVIELSAAPNFREEAQQCLHLASTEPEGELRTILEGMARGWLMMADCPGCRRNPKSCLSNRSRKIKPFNSENLRAT
jgi:hypothetical protein